MRHPFVDALIAKQERGERVPMLDERPQLNEIEAFYYQAFADLTTCRGPAVSGVGAIPWLAATTYCNERGIFDPDDRAELWTHISGMDSVFVAHVARQIKENVAAGNK